MYLTSLPIVMIMFLLFWSKIGKRPSERKRNYSWPGFDARKCLGTRGKNGRRPQSIKITEYLH